MFCTKCGYNLGEANFCPQCGNQVKKSGQTVTPVAAPVEPVVTTVVEEVTPVVEETVAPVVEEVAETVEEKILVEPIAPVMQEIPVQPEIPTPVMQETPVQPVAPAPVMQETPVQPETPTPVMQETPVQPVAPAPVMQETPVQPVTPAPVMQQPPVQPVAPTPVMQQSAPQQSAPQSGDSNLTWNSQTQQMWNTYQPTTKKKSKAPIIIGIVAVLVICLCVGAALVAPMFLNKKKEQETADTNLSGATVLKSVTADIKNSASNLTNNMTVVKLGSKQKTTGSFTLNKLVVDDENYMSYLNVDTVNYEVEMDSDTGKMSMIFSLAKGKSTPIVNVHMYTDGKTMYIRIPELATNSLKSSVETNTTTEDGTTVETSDAQMSAIIKAMSNMDEETMKQYAKVFEAVIGHMVTGLDHVIDKAQYTKNEGTVTVSAGDLGSEAYESYLVTVSKAEIIAGYNKAIDAIFDDTTIVPYITMLNTIGAKLDKDTLKSEFSDGMKDSPETYKFTMYTKDSKFAGIGINVADYDSKETGTITLMSVGGESVYIGMEHDNEYMKFCYDGRSENKKFTLDCDFEDSYYTMYYEWKMSGTSMEIVKYELTGKDTSNGSNLALSMSAKADAVAITGVSVSEASFPNLIDTDKATEAEQMAFMSQFSQNYVTLMKKMLSDKGFQKLQSSSSNSGTGNGTGNGTGSGTGVELETGASAGNAA